MAEDGLILTEGQVAALEKQRHNDDAVGEIETEHPDHLGSQDTFYVGTLKGVGRIYQQTFVDTYSKWATAKLYRVQDGGHGRRLAQRPGPAVLRESRRGGVAHPHRPGDRVLRPPR